LQVNLLTPSWITLQEYPLQSCFKMQKMQGWKRFIWKIILKLLFQEIIAYKIDSTQLQCSVGVDQILKIKNSNYRYKMNPTP
jgi:hypothetical protein